MCCGSFVFSFCSLLYYTYFLFKIMPRGSYAKVSAADRRVLLNVRMAAAIGRLCVQIFGSIPKRLTDGSKVVLKSGDPTLVAGARLLRKSRWMLFAE